MSASRLDMPPVAGLDGQIGLLLAMLDDNDVEAYWLHTVGAGEARFEEDMKPTIAAKTSCFRFCTKDIRKILVFRKHN